MEYVNCNLCGANDFTVVFPKEVAQLHRIVRCNKCDLMYANPQELVDSVKFMAEDPSAVYSETNGEYFQKQLVQLPDNLRTLAVLNGFFPQRGKLLEVGTFCGVFLDRIQRDGWDATGLEPYGAAANYARSKYGLKIIDGVLPKPELPDGSFDVILMLHVIEHMSDPTANLRELRRLLKPGGILALETPRFDSLMFKLLGRRERSLSNCNGHIYFFTVPTLRRMLEKCGFEVARVDLVGRTLTFQRLFTNVGIISRSDRVKRMLSSLSQKLHLGRHHLYLNMRDMQRLYSRAK